MEALKVIARWSRNNLAFARTIIVVLHIAIGIICTYVGITLSSMHVHIPVLHFWLACCTFIVFSFSFRKVVTRASTYKSRKTSEGLILLSVMAMTITSANQTTPAHFIFDAPLHGNFVKIKVTENTTLTTKDLPKPSPEPGAKKGASAGAIILAILVGLLLAGVILSLACSLACSEQGALAILVTIGGLVGIVFLMRLIIQSSKRRRRSATASA